MPISPVSGASSYGSFYEPISSTTDSITGVETGSSTGGFVATTGSSTSGGSSGGALAGSVTTSYTLQPPTNLFDDRYFAPSAYLLSFPQSGLDTTQPIYNPSNQAWGAYLNPQPLVVTQSSTASVSSPQLQTQTGTGGTAGALYQDGQYGLTTTIVNPNNGTTTTISQTASVAGSYAATSTGGLQATMNSISNVVSSLDNLAQSFPNASGSGPIDGSATASTAYGSSSGYGGGTASVTSSGALTVDAGAGTTWPGGTTSASSGAGGVLASATGAYSPQPTWSGTSLVPFPTDGTLPPFPMPTLSSTVPGAATAGPSLPPIVYPAPPDTYPIVNGLAVVPVPGGNTVPVPEPAATGNPGQITTMAYPSDDAIQLPVGSWPGGYGSGWPAGSAGSATGTAGSSAGAGGSSASAAAGTAGSGSAVTLRYPSDDAFQLPPVAPPPPPPVPPPGKAWGWHKHKGHKVKKGSGGPKFSGGPRHRPFYGAIATAQATAGGSAAAATTGGAASAAASAATGQAWYPWR